MMTLRSSYAPDAADRPGELTKALVELRAAMPRLVAAGVLRQSDLEAIDLATALVERCDAGKTREMFTHISQTLVDLGAPAAAATSIEQMAHKYAAAHTVAGYVVGLVVARYRPFDGITGGVQ